MTRHYSTKSLFRHVSNSLLARYFETKGLFGDLDFATMKKPQIDALFDAWLELPDKPRSSLDAELLEIFELSCEKGYTAILDEARWRFQENPDALHIFIDTLTALPSHYDRAMLTYLDYQDFWKVAALFYHADSLSYWRKRKNMGHQFAATDEASRKDLADKIRYYFHYTEGRGQHCFVESFRRGDRDYFFAYPEDHSQQNPEWVNGKLDKRPHNPAFEIVFIYSQKEGSLDLNFRGNYKAVEPLQKMFATAILHLDELPPNPKENRPYILDQLSQRNFSFNYEAGSGIKDVVVKKLRLASRIKKGDRITIEANTDQNRNAVYDLYDQIGQTVPLDLYDVTQVELEATVVVDALKPVKTVTIRLTHPRSCSLKYDALDIKLREMLIASGIEFVEREALEELPDTVDA